MHNGVDEVAGRGVEGARADPGERLGALLRDLRGARSMVEVAATAGISVETLRKIETGRIPTPAFFTVSALALGLSLDVLAAATEDPPRVRHSASSASANVRTCP